MTEDDGMTLHHQQELYSQPNESPACMAKHTKYQPGIGDWKCPKCGALAESEKPFIIDEPAEEADEDCNLLHLHDVCVCANCGYQAQGNAVARALAKKNNMVTCSKCGGKGVVRKR